jgi:DNA-binding XRE family transcriptional regulator
MNKLKEIRRQKRLTQIELGQAIGKYQSFIHNIEKGYYLPTDEEKQLLAQVLRVNVSDIFFK